MKKFLKPSSLKILLFLSLFLGIKNHLIAFNSVDQPKKVKVIFDTDMGPDYDDIGAIAILHALADQGKAEILATVASDAHKDIPATIEVYNKYYKRDGIPVGKTSNPLAPNFTAPNNWNVQIIKKFYPELLNKNYENAVSIYRKVLAEQPDNSVTLITVGFMTNISELLQSNADQYSKLNGMDLVKKKVKNWVAMAAAFPQGKEFNVFKDAESAKYAFDNFPKPILFSGFEIGDRIKTGGKIAERNLLNSPVSVGYKINLETYANEAVKNRSSWDQTAVLIAIENPEDYFYLSGPGKLIVDEEGNNLWEPNKNGLHKFIIHKYPYDKLESVIDELMLQQPK
ncbi:nucleoside hydrolase [Sphingobacterium cellulitidis]|uniref:nucleoside hydrolase n=1 Tax=Sphingobacterium cellulitidis TaxID=1768011 RepID=UPI003C7DB2E6